MNNNVKIEKYFPPLYEGHNTEMRYRYLGLFPVAAIGYEIIKSQIVLLVRYKYPGSGLFRKVPYNPLNPNTLKFFMSTVPLYLLFDMIYRNRKYMNDTSIGEKIAYSTDLTLFHLLATCYLPYKIVGLSAQRIPLLMSYITRNRTPLMLLSTSTFFLLGMLQVKSIDILVDILLDHSFRKFYDFKVKNSDIKVQVVPPAIHQEIKIEKKVEFLPTKVLPKLKKEQVKADFEFNV